MIKLSLSASMCMVPREMLARIPTQAREQYQENAS